MLTLLLSSDSRLHGQLHDRVYNVVGVIFQRLDGLGARDVGLGHDQLDVLVLDPSLVYSVSILLLLLRDGSGPSGASCPHLSGLWHLGCLELLSCLHLSLLGEVFYLGLAKHDVSVRGWVLVHVGLVDHEQDVLRLSDRDPGDTRDLLQAELGHDLPGLLLPPALLGLAGIIPCSASSSSYSRLGSSITAGLLQLRDRVIVTVRVGAGVIIIADLLGLGVKNLGKLRHGGVRRCGWEGRGA